jgi:hypothetical protein
LGPKGELQKTENIKKHATRLLTKNHLTNRHLGDTNICSYSYDLVIWATSPYKSLGQMSCVTYIIGAKVVLPLNKTFKAFLSFFSEEF